MHRKHLSLVATFVASFFAIPIVGPIAHGQPMGPKEAPGATVDQTLWNWRGSVLTMEFSRDGARLVTGGAAAKSSVNVWDPATGRRIVGIDAGAIVYSLSVTPNGKRIATSGFVEDGKDEYLPRAAVWNAETGKKIFDIDDPRVGKKPCLAYSPDGKLLATNTLVGGEDKSAGAVQLRNADTGEKVGTPLVGLSETFSRILFSPDGKMLAAASWGERTYVIVWEVESRKRIVTLETKATWTLIRSLAFSADATRLVWATGNEVAPDRPEHVLWDIPSGRRLGALLTDHRLAWIAFGPEADQLRSVSLDSGIERWSLKTLKRTANIEPGIESMTQSACLSPDGKTLAIGTGTSDALAAPSPEYGAIHLVDAATGRERLSPAAEAERRKVEAEEAALVAVGERLRKKARDGDASKSVHLLRYAIAIGQAQLALDRGCMATAKKVLADWIPEPGAEDLRSFEWHHLWTQCPVRTFDCEHREAIHPTYRNAQPFLSPDGKVLAVADIQDQATLWDLATGKERFVVKAAGPIAKMEFSPGSTFLAVVVGRKKFTRENNDSDAIGVEAVVWDAKTGDVVANLETGSREIRSVAFAPDDKSLALGCGDGSVLVHALPSGKVSATLAESKESVVALAFTPDGKSLAIGGEAGELRTWTVGSKATQIERKERKAPIGSLRFDAEGKQLFSTEGGYTYPRGQRWTRSDDGTWNQTREWPRTNRVTLSPDGKRLAIMCWDGVFLWDLSEDKEIGRIVPRVIREGLGSLAVFSPDSRTLLVYAENIRGEPEFVLFDADTGARRGVLDGVAHGKVTGMHLGADGLMTATTDEAHRNVRMSQHVVMATIGQAVRRRPIQGAKSFGRWGIDSIDFDAKNERLAISDGDGLYVWSLKDDRVQEYGPYNNFPIRGARFSADGRRVLSGGSSGYTIWDTATQKSVARIGSRYGATSTDGKTIFAFDEPNGFQTHSTADGSVLASILAPQFGIDVPGNPDARSYYDEVNVSRSGRWVVGPSVILYDTFAKKRIAEFKPLAPPHKIAFSPDERMLVLSDDVGKLVVWDLPAVKPRYAVPNVGTILAIAPDSRTAVVVSRGGDVSLFDLQTAGAIAPIDGLTGPVECVKFSPDGRTLAIGTADGMFGFWCPWTGAPRMTTRTSHTAVKSICFSHDGQAVAIGAGESVLLRRADR
jgi:WD40 repeat protein